MIIYAQPVLLCPECGRYLVQEGKHMSAPPRLTVRCDWGECSQSGVLLDVLLEPVAARVTGRRG